MKLKVYAIVPSAGMGKRFGVEKNKPFFAIGGKPIMVRAMENMQSMKEIAEIIPVVKEEDLTATAELVDEYGLTKVRQIVPGGAERQDSVYNGLKAVQDDDAIVIIHDGGRPFAESRIFLDAIKSLEGCDGVIAAVKVKDTIKQIREGSDEAAPVVDITLNRSLLYAVQTPQVFRLKTLREAHEKARKEKYYGTDDAALIERYGGTIRISDGSYSNIKITTPEDVSIGEAILKSK